MISCVLLVLHLKARAAAAKQARKNQQGFEEQDQEAHVPEAPPLPVSPQIFRQESSAEAGCKVTKKTKGTAKAVARIVDEKKRFKIKWRGYQVSEIAAKCLQLARQGRRKKAVEKLKERLKAS
ncbi:unnamed protein product [Effrenium voratum]|uniref:Uncharacterized protein n=2 Tax=Effrenium voratum TaxID=2562239 RepID=A0AA36MXK0_9DINO|nr:unnamed protein product [Effrenium voratum]CAJ1455627.1 unnamed protein product [Effrenium voratum]CAJ1456962.1 unnamed protein product [Effrenium voratum]CAJ1459142.1 unnamed protein product [Effrenium voratum]